MRLLVVFISLQMFCLYADAMECLNSIDSIMQQLKKGQSPLTTKVKTVCKEQLKSIENENIKKLVEAKVLSLLSDNQQIRDSSWANCNIYGANIIMTMQNPKKVLADVDNQITECLRYMIEHETEAENKKKMQNAINIWLSFKNKILLNKHHG